MQSQSGLKWLTVGGSLFLVAILVGILEKERVSAMLVTEKPAQVTKPATPRIESIDESVYQIVIKDRLKEVQACYNSLLKKGLSKSGKLVVQWMVNPNGTASGFNEELNELESTELYDCTTTAISHWPFPKGQNFQIRYTFKMHELASSKKAREVASRESAKRHEPKDEVQEALGE